VDVQLENAHNANLETMLMIREILSQLEQPFTGEELFDHLPDSVFFIKNARGEYVVVNKTLVERCGLRDKRELIGRTPGEVLRPPLGKRFAEQDQDVLRTGQPLLSQLELHVYPSREVGWCLTTKLPLRKRGGGVAGLVGVSQDLRLPDLDTDEYQHITAALAHAERNLSAPPSVEELAGIAAMSRYQLDRRMRRVFGLTTGQWLLKVRIDLAQRQLRETNHSIATIALRAGYSDQSAFTRQFRRATGLSPSEYRGARTRDAK
jgi:AraC-like DNA-binding protein